MSVATPPLQGGSPADSRTLGLNLTLIGPASAWNLADVLVDDPQLERTIDGATVADLTCKDHDRSLLRSAGSGSGNYCVLDGVRLEQSAFTKSGDTITLTMEDAVVRALKRVKTPKVITGGTLTRAGIARLFAAEAGVAVVCDPTARPVVADAVTRNMRTAPQSATSATSGVMLTSDNAAALAAAIGGGGSATTLTSANAAALTANGGGTKAYEADPKGQDTSWSVLASLAADVGWRCCSDGQTLLFGSDAWLMTRQAPIAVAEYTGPVQGIDLELDVDQATSSATVTVDVQRWAVPAGQSVLLSGMGPGDGVWLVESFRRPLLRQRGTVTLTRARPSLVEPPPSNAATADYGEAGFLTDSGGDGSGAGMTSIAVAEGAGSPLSRFLNFALAQAGHPYVWSGSGPTGYDCSGLVQQAAAAAGLRFPKPVSAQAQAVTRGAGTVLTVAQGIATRGALLMRVGYPGEGDHIVISLGDGRTVEARGKAYGCGIWAGAASRHWNFAAFLNFGASGLVGSGQSIGGPR